MAAEIQRTSSSERDPEIDGGEQTHLVILHLKLPNGFYKIVYFVLKNDNQVARADS